MLFGRINQQKSAMLKPFSITRAYVKFCQHFLQILYFFSVEKMFLNTFNFGVW